MKKYNICGTALLLLNVIQFFILLNVNVWVGKAGVLGIGGFFLHSYVAWLFLPIPLSTAALCFYMLKKQKEATILKVTRIVSFISACLMMFYGTFFIKYRNDYEIDYGVMREIAQITDVAFPENGDACKSILENGYEIEGAFEEGKEREQFVSSIKSDKRFTKTFPTSIPCAIPHSSSFVMCDYFFVFNVSTSMMVDVASSISEGDELIVFGYNEDREVFLVRVFQVS